MNHSGTHVRLHGELGKALERTAANRLKKVNYRILEEPFVLRNEADNGWRCEFWGKIVRSAILANDSLRDAELAQIIETTVRNMLAAQSEDGCISSYPYEKQCGGWDLWGRKYVLLALLRYYDLVKQDEAVKNCCAAMVDHLMTQTGPDKKDIRKSGEHGGLAPCSILGAIVGVYRITGEKRFLDFARYIIGTGCSVKHDIFAAAREGVYPMNIGNGKSYEMTSCFQGMAELYLLDPQEEYKETCEKYFTMLCERELFVTGVAGLRDCYGEYWFDGKFKQTRSDSGCLGETCVTTTFLHYCEAVDNAAISAEISNFAERSFYNGILGAMSPDGSQWIHVNPTPLTGGGAKIPADDQIKRGFGTPYDGNDCCLAQGPEALALAPRMAVRSIANGAYLNILEPLTASLPDGSRILVKGNYPAEEAAEISVECDVEFKLLVRIPEFCRDVKLNGEKMDFVCGKYLEIKRIWNKNDVLTMEFDFTLREISAPDGSEYTAILCGPWVLAESASDNERDAVIRREWGGRKVTDYASAGNRMNADDTLTVWFAN